METHTEINKDGFGLRILMLEDVAEDAELMQHELRQNNINFLAEVVDTKEAFIKALQQFRPDIILADYSLPAFNGLHALDIAHESDSDSPFIFVTGAMGEEKAVEFLKKGATDYVLKAKLERLPAAVKRAIAERNERRERTRAERELKRLAEAVENIVEGVAIISPGLTFDYVNPGLCKMTGYSSDELLGQGVSFIGIDGGNTGHSAIWDHVAAGHVWSGRLSYKRKDGTDSIDETTVSCLRDESGVLTAFIAVLRDVSQEERLEEQLRQAQKMEALGVLAGGIAHDFNNILAAMMGFTELVRDHLPEKSREAHHLDRVIEGGLRARDLIKQMLTFSRKTEQERKPLRLSTIVKETAKLLRASIPTTIGIAIDVKNESGLILADPTHIQQVIMNLCTNAAFAMGEKGGSIYIELSDYTVSSQTGPGGMEPGLYMKLTVRDTGTGIAPEHLNKIFDPFFTTKKAGEGSGLGLSVVHGIIRQSNGYITVESELGKGTCFVIYLPQVAEEITADAVIDTSIPTGSERILFVDDEALVVEMGEEILAELGYDVTISMSSLEALSLLKKDPRRFDLIITDQTMPHMTGVELAEAIFSIRHDMPIILCTGFSHAVDADKAHEAGIKAFAMKPLTKREIARTVRKVLDEG